MEECLDKFNLEEHLKKIAIHNIMFTQVDMTIHNMNAKHINKDNTFCTKCECDNIMTARMLVPSDIKLSQEEVYYLILLSHSLGKYKPIEPMNYFRSLALDNMFVRFPFTNKSGNIYNIYHSIGA